MANASTIETQPINILAQNTDVVIDEMYSYTGGFRSGAYLVPHAIEEKHFSERCGFSHMVSFFSPVVDAMVRPVFDSKQKRVTNNPKMQEFIKNCDNRGTPLQTMMRYSATEMRKHSNYFLIVDNLPADAMPETDEQAVQQRAIPYIYRKRAQDVVDFEIDRFGRAESITFANGIFEDGEIKGSKFLTINTKAFIEHTKAEDKEGNSSEKIIRETPHPLGKIPVVLMQDNLPEQGELLANQKLYGLMRICHAVFNKDSEMREIERKQEFSMAVFYSDNPTALSVGTGNAIILGKEDKSPHFLEPNVGILSGLLETRTALREDLYRVAEQNGVVGIQSAKSGTAMAFEFMARDSILKETAELCETAERAIADLFFLWIGEPYDYEVEYTEDYTPSDDATTLKWIDLAMMSDLPDTVKAQIMQIIARKINPKISDDELSNITLELESNALDKRSAVVDKQTDTEDDMTDGE